MSKSWKVYIPHPPRISDPERRGTRRGERCCLLVLGESRVKGIFSDSNNIFLWHESEDINKKSLFPKFELIPILRFQVMHDYVCFIAPIGYCVI